MPLTALKSRSTLDIYIGSNVQFNYHIYIILEPTHPLNICSNDQCNYYNLLYFVLFQYMRTLFRPSQDWGPASTAERETVMPFLAPNQAGNQANISVAMETSPNTYIAPMENEDIQEKV